MNQSVLNKTGSGVFVPLMIGVALGVGLFLGLSYHSAAPSVELVSMDGSKDTFALNGNAPGRMEEVLRFIEARYVDDVDGEVLINRALDNLMGELDPHSQYIPLNEVQRSNEKMEGKYDGIGFEYLIVRDTIVVASVIEGGPSQVAGINSGDKIIEVDGSQAVGDSLVRYGFVESMFRGEAGSIVNIKIKRDGQDEFLTFRIERDEIEAESVDVFYMLDSKTGYIKVTRFIESTYNEFMQGVEAMSEDGLKNLVIDLRQNPGGYLHEVVKILSQLFEDKGVLLLYTEGENESRQEYVSTGRRFFDIEDVVVLIDEGSASASEVLAGAIQDHDRGWIIGRRSFGKGLVQEQYNLSEGSAVRLTVARYYTPSGRSLQKPFIGNEYDEDYYFDRIESGELINRDSIKEAIGRPFYTDLGRLVYGGGGITPDLFVPIVGIKIDPEKLEYLRYVKAFGLDFWIQNKRKLLKINESNFYDTLIGIDWSILEHFGVYLTKTLDRNVGIELKELNSKDLKFLSYQLVGEVARYRFSKKEMYKIINKDDLFLREAMQVIKEEREISSLLIE